MEKIIDKKYGREDVFEPVTEFPLNYEVWNIGRHNFQHEKCIPLCKDGYNPEPWMHNIDLNSLKYIVVESEELALRILDEAIRHGVDRKRFYEMVNA